VRSNLRVGQAFNNYFYFNDEFLATKISKNNLLVKQIKQRKTTKKKDLGPVWIEFILSL